MKDKYKFQRTMNKITGFLWSAFMRIILLILLIGAVIFCLPWLKALWDTIAG